MALMGNSTINIFGKDVEFEDTYIRITNIEGCKDNIRVWVDTLNSKKEHRIQRQSFEFTPSMDENFISQGYKYLKTLENFKHCKDI